MSNYSVFGFSQVSEDSRKAAKEQALNCQAHWHMKGYRVTLIKATCEYIVVWHETPVSQAKAGIPERIKG